MQRNDLLSDGRTIYRILEVNGNSALILDCASGNMPKQVDISNIAELQSATYQELLDKTNTILSEIEGLSWRSQRLVQERYSLIAPILPVVADKRKRNAAIDQIMHSTGISKQTIRHYLCLYLAFQDKSVLVPQDTESRHKFSQDEKNMRWALNKYYYTAHKNSLQTAYTLMLKEKYSRSGSLIENYPSFNQFKYFYRKTRNMQTYYISRDGLSNYQRNHRPLTGDGVQSFASVVGVGMIDATVCDIYLVDDAGNLVGRPILTACIDAYSSLCMGYTLSWEGGVYSLKNVALNMIADKVDWCLQFGIHIKPEDWDCTSLPGMIVSDMGREYKSENFEQISELGIKIVNLPPYRPELKGSVEKFFDLVQSLYKPHLKSKGVISPDYQERGTRDYRKDACLTMQQFALSELQTIYIPSQMSYEIYSKLYLALVRSLQKKCSSAAIQRRNENHKAIISQKYNGIIGGSDSFTILGTSGIGKSSAINRAIQLISNGKIIEMKNPYTRIIPCVVVQCPFDSSVKGLLLEILRNVDEHLQTTYYLQAIRARSTTDMLIGVVSQVSLNHIGILIVDEIQNVCNNQHGKSLVGMLTQLINNSGISICMVGTPESATFFEQAMQLARRSLGLQYGALEYTGYFCDFCKTVFKYQFLKNRTEITPAILQWLFEHSGGIISVVISLLYDSQEIAILSGREILDSEALEEAYQKRLVLLHNYIQLPKRKPTTSIRSKSITPPLPETNQNEADHRRIADIVAAAKAGNWDVTDMIKQHYTIVEVTV